MAARTERRKAALNESAKATAVAFHDPNNIDAMLPTGNAGTVEGDAEKGYVDQKWWE